LKSIIWRKSWNVFIKNLNFFSTEERKTWTSWMTRGWVNYQQKIFQKWTTPLTTELNQPWTDFSWTALFSFRAAEINSASFPRYHCKGAL